MSTISSDFTWTEPFVSLNAWIFAIAELDTNAGRSGHMHSEASACGPPRRVTERRHKLRGDDVPVHYQPHAVATFVERISDRSILVNWCDSTSCHYCDQLWIRRPAREPGYCALTGDLITRGDIVYGPYTRVAHPPANERAMILASSLAPVHK